MGFFQGQFHRVGGGVFKFGQVGNGLVKGGFSQGNLGFFQGQFHRVNIGGFEFSPVADGDFLTGGYGLGFGFEGKDFDGGGAAFQFSQLVAGFLQGGLRNGNGGFQRFGLGNDAGTQHFPILGEQFDIPLPALDVGVEAKFAVVVFGLQGLEGGFGFVEAGFSSSFFLAAGRQGAVFILKILESLLGVVEIGLGLLEGLAGFG